MLNEATHNLVFELRCHFLGMSHRINPLEKIRMVFPFSILSAIEL